MRIITVLRALAWLGAAVALWSVNLRWGADPALGAGAPDTWERHVVGAALLAGLAALAISISGRGAAPPRLPYRLAGAAAAAAGLAVAVSIYVRVNRSITYEHMAGIVNGPGFAWLAAGTALTTGAALATFALREPPARTTASRRRARRRR